MYATNDVHAIAHPTIKEIIWFAGFYEGEGSCHCSYVTHHNLRAEIKQKDFWVMDRLVYSFGGKTRSEECRRFPIFVWHLYSARAAGFLMTIYPLLSPRRQE